MAMAGGFLWTDAAVRRGRLVSLLRSAAPSTDGLVDPAAQELQGPRRMDALLAVRRRLPRDRIGRGDRPDIPGGSHRRQVARDIAGRGATGHRSPSGRPLVR